MEDDPALSASLKQGLQQMGFAVELSHDGVEADAILTLRTFDLVVLDLGLPSLPGTEVLKRFRKRGAATPVLILSARDALEDRVAGLKAGADDYVLKPFDFEELEARLHALLRRTHSERSGFLEAGELRLDKRSRQAYCRNHPLSLSSREEAVLELLMGHRLHWRGRGVHHHAGAHGGGREGNPGRGNRCVPHLRQGHHGHDRPQEARERLHEAGPAFLVGAAGGTFIGGAINRVLYDKDPILSEAFISLVYAVLLGFIGFYALMDFMKSRKGTAGGDAHGGPAGTTDFALKLQKMKIPPMNTFDEIMSRAARGSRACSLPWAA